MRQVQPETLPKNSNCSSCLTPLKTPNSGQFSYPLPNIVSFLFRLEFRFRSRDFFFNLFPVWQPYCWRFWSAIVVHIHTSTINAPELRERIIKQLLSALAVNIINVHPWDVVLSRAKALGWTTTMFTLSAGNNRIMSQNWNDEITWKIGYKLMMEW